MKTIIETPRLILRELRPEDAPDFWALNEDPEVIKYTGDPPFENIEAAKTFLEQYPDYKQNGYGRWAVIEKATNAFIGWCGLKLHPEGYVDLGYRFFKKDWNKGFATESARAALEYGFSTLLLEEIVGRVVEENVASIRVLEKMGMTFWKRDTCKGLDNSMYFKVAATSFLNR